jgi:hypothetical protein
MVMWDEFRAFIGPNGLEPTQSFFVFHSEYGMSAAAQRFELFHHFIWSSYGDTPLPTRDLMLEMALPNGAGDWDSYCSNRAHLQVDPYLGVTVSFPPASAAFSTDLMRSSVHAGALAELRQLLRKTTVPVSALLTAAAVHWERGGVNGGIEVRPPSSLPLATRHKTLELDRPFLAVVYDTPAAAGNDWMIAEGGSVFYMAAVRTLRGRPHRD